MYLGTYNLGESVAFDFQALDGNGQAIDATGLPAFEVFCDNAPMTPAVTGVMTKIDGQTGFYGGSVAATQDNGFAGDKSYTLRITATISGVETLLTHTFQLDPFVAPSAAPCTGFPTVVWAPACSDGYTAALIASAVATINTFDSLDVVYQPAGKPARTIRGLVRFQPPSRTAAPQGIAPLLHLSVLNSSEVGISAIELDTGLDTVRVPLRVGGQLQSRRLSQIIHQDAGLLTLEVR